MVIETLESSKHKDQRLTHAAGLVQLWSPEGPVCRPIPLADEDELTLGREGTVALADPRASRQHCRVTVAGEKWTVEDLGSRNGTFVGGEQLHGHGLFDELRPLRVGHSMFISVPDIGPYHAGVTLDGDLVIGPQLREIRQTIADVARAGERLLICGPSGAGKELAARHYHACSQTDRSTFIAVNCAAIPEGLAERLLFGTTKGAYSGATESAQGYLQAANGGTFFLDEVGELDLAVQGKLLRVIETRELLVLGSTRPIPVDIRMCFATHRDLRRLVGQKKFRQDLYFRISNPEVHLPALQDRLVEIPFIAQSVLAGMAPPRLPHASLVESCIVRSWPGNVRELMAELRAAARTSMRTDRVQVEHGDLSLTAGMVDPFLEPAPDRSAPVAAPAGQSIVGSERLDDRGAIEEALRDTKGNVRGAARRLGVHRNQLRRWLDKQAIDPRTFGDAVDE